MYYHKRERLLSNTICRFSEQCGVAASKVNKILNNYRTVVDRIIILSTCYYDLLQEHARNIRTDTRTNPIATRCRSPLSCSRCLARRPAAFVVNKRIRLETKLITPTHSAVTTRSSTAGLCGVEPSRNR